MLCQFPLTSKIKSHSDHLTEEFKSNFYVNKNLNMFLIWLSSLLLLNYSSITIFLTNVFDIGIVALVDEECTK